MMSEFNNPLDKTIWDPVNPEFAIEDPFHGSEAIMASLAIPPYRNEDGTFHVFGASHFCGTCTFDAEGRPFVKIKPGYDPGFLRELEAHTKWIEAFHSGELPPREEMELPEFQVYQVPYFVMDEPKKPSGWRQDEEIEAYIADKVRFGSDIDREQIQRIVDQLSEASGVPNLHDVLGNEPPIIEE